LVELDSIAQANTKIVICGGHLIAHRFFCSVSRKIRDNEPKKKIPNPKTTHSFRSRWKTKVPLGLPIAEPSYTAPDQRSQAIEPKMTSPLSKDTKKSVNELLELIARLIAQKHYNTIATSESSVMERDTDAERQDSTQRR
jgi:hypothetical protein